MKTETIYLNQALAEEHLTRRFRQFAATIQPAEREQFFHPINRSGYLIEFAAWLDAKARERASND